MLSVGGHGGHHNRVNMNKSNQGAAHPSPILNGPCDEPARHDATDLSGHLDCQQPRKGRRMFAPDNPHVPLGSQDQGSVFDLNDFASDHRDSLVNQMREHVSSRRREGWPGVTSRDRLSVLRVDTQAKSDNDARDHHRQRKRIAAASVKAKAERTLKIEIDGEAFERLCGVISLPVAFERGKRVAMPMISQFGEESTKVVVL